MKKYISNFILKTFQQIIKEFMLIMMIKFIQCNSMKRNNYIYNTLK